MDSWAGTGTHVCSVFLNNILFSLLRLSSLAQLQVLGTSHSLALRVVVGHQRCHGRGLRRCDRARFLRRAVLLGSLGGNFSFSCSI